MKFNVSETSVNNYQPQLGNIPEERRPQFLLVSCCLHNLQNNDTDTSKDFLFSPQDTVDWKTDNLIASNSEAYLDLRCAIVGICIKL